MDENQKSRIVIDFAGVGSVVCNISFENIVPEQVMLVASILEVQGKNVYMQQRNAIAAQESQKKLFVPTPGIPANDVRKIVLGKK
jgi:hypothetical protein